MENQRFSSYDVICVYGALLTCVLAVSFLLQSSRDSIGGTEAQKEMVKLSRQILSGGISTLSPNEESSRTVASENEVNTMGQIGQDPWGHPYQYKLFSLATGIRTVVIWSVGPNGSNDTRDEDILMSQNGRPLRILSRVDDVSHIESGL